MANDYYTRQGSYTKGTLARGDVVKSDYDALVTAWDLGQTNIKRAIKLPNEGTPQTDWAITDTPTNRIGKVIGFDTAGDLELQTGVGNWEGTWATSTAYSIRDVVVDGAAGASTDNLYICLVAHTSGTWSTDLSAAKWELMVNVSEAREWARKTDGIVDSTDYSSKAWAIGGTDVTTTASRGAAKEWAVATGLVDTASYSSKEYSQGTTASTGGSAKDFAQKTDGGVSGATTIHSSKAWAVGGTGITSTASKGASKEWAITAEDSTVDGTSYSSLHHAAKSAASASASSSSSTASASSATASASSATASASSATASASSASAAAASYDAFDDRYLGSKSSDPSVDNDGNTLLDGALYFNTTNNVMMVYDLGTTTWLRTTPTTTDQGHINTVSGIAANVTTVAGISTDVTAVAGKATEVGLLGVSAVITDMGILGTADVVTDMNVLGTADVVSDMNTLGTADVVSDMNVLATADVVTDMNTLGTADVVSDMNTLGTADVVTDMNTLGTASNVTNMSTVAASIADVNRYANEYTISSSAPGSPSAGDLWYDSVSSVLKYYNGSVWAALSGDTDVLVGNSASDTTPGYLSAKVAAGNNVTLTTLNSGGNEQLQITAADNSAAMALALGG
tara:strand:+ start:29837 stop:31714 length:1878 start_codon:yes stop_codon:yes gene_type:complete